MTNEEHTNLETTNSFTDPAGVTHTSELADLTDTGGNTVVAPNCIVYEDSGGTAHAQTSDTDFTGTDIFDALQQAIDDRLSESRPGFRDGTGTDSGDFFVHIKPAVYNVSNNISITQASTERIVIECAGIQGAYIDTSGFGDGNTATENFVFDIDPGDFDSGSSVNDRNYSVTLRGLYLDHQDSATARDAHGVYVNNTSWLNMEHCNFRGYARGLLLENVWQGIVSDLWTSGCGLDAQDWPAIQVGKSGRSTGEDAESSALNHIEFHHLQGDSNGTTERAWFETRGRVRQIMISQPNIEGQSDVPTFLFGRGARFDAPTGGGATDGEESDDEGRHEIIMTGGKLRYGAPTIEIRGAQLTMSGTSIQDADTDAIHLNAEQSFDVANDFETEYENFPEVYIGNCSLDAANAAIRHERGILTVSGGSATGETRGIVSDGSPANANPFSLTVSGGARVESSTNDDTHQAAIKLNQANGRQYNINGINIGGAAAGGENPIYISGASNVLIGGVMSRADAAVDTIRADGATLMYYGIVNTGSSTGTFNDAGGNTLQTFNSS